MAVIRMERPLRNNRTLGAYANAAIQEVIHTLAAEYKGRPLWNHPHGLLEPFPSVQEMYPKWPYFVAVRNKFKADGVFDSESLYILTKEEQTRKVDHCEVLATCNCSNDSHCAVGEMCLTKKLAETDIQFCDRVPN